MVGNILKKPSPRHGLKILGFCTSQNGRDFDLLRKSGDFSHSRPTRTGDRLLLVAPCPMMSSPSISTLQIHRYFINKPCYMVFEGHKAKAKDWLVVEGYMDVISLHQAGVYGAVASMGTALAQSQIERLLQFNPILTLSFDGDSAGQKSRLACHGSWDCLRSLDGKELHFWHRLIIMTLIVMSKRMVC